MYREKRLPAGLGDRSSHRRFYSRHGYSKPVFGDGGNSGRIVMVSESENRGDGNVFGSVFQMRDVHLTVSGPVVPSWTNCWTAPSA